MPPKRGRSSKDTSSKTPQSKKQTPSTRAMRSSAIPNKTTNKLSDHSPQNDAEILRAFSLFATTRSDAEDEDESLDDDGEGVIKIGDVRRCLSTLTLPKPPSDFFDDPEQTYITRREFLELAQTLRETMPSAPSEMDTDGHDNEYAPNLGREDDDQAQEISHAFSLFTNSRQGPNVRITLADLKRVAMDLRDDVDEGTLRLMIEEANGEMGRGSVGRGVRIEEFEAVMRRAGVFG